MVSGLILAINVTDVTMWIFTVQSCCISSYWIAFNFCNIVTFFLFFEGESYKPYFHRPSWRRLSNIIWLLWGWQVSCAVLWSPLSLQPRHCRDQKITNDGDEIKFSLLCKNMPERWWGFTWIQSFPGIALHIALCYARSSAGYWNPGADLGGGCRGCASSPTPEITCGFLIQLVFCQKKHYMVYWCWSRARDECTPS